MNQPADILPESSRYALQRFVPSKTMQDWTDHRFVITTLDELTHFKPLWDGTFRCTDLFKIGASIGLMINSRENVDLNEGKPGQSIWVGKYEWSKVEVCQAIQDVVELTGGVNNLTPLELPNDANLKKVLEIFLAWFGGEFLNKIGDEIHASVFWLGTNVGIFQDDFLRESITLESLPDEWKDDTIRNRIQDLVKFGFTGDSKNYQDTDEIDIHRKKLIELGLTPSGVPSPTDKSNHESTINPSFIYAINTHLMPLLDSVALAVPLVSIKGAFENVDWEYLKHGARSRFESGDRFVSLIYLANGILAIQPGFQLAKLGVLKPISDPDDEIYFIDEKAGIKIAILKKWTEIILVIKNYDNS